jgi:hypothetical protein
VDGLAAGRPVLLLGRGGRREREQVHERPARRRDRARHDGSVDPDRSRRRHGDGIAGLALLERIDGRLGHRRPLPGDRESGGRNVVVTGATSATVVGLEPSTTYTFAVRARDAGWNFSAYSSGVAATTAASTDTTPPAAVTDLRIGHSASCEIVVRWTQTTDDQDPQSAIRYELFDNGIFDPNFAHVIGVGRWTSYGFEGSNTWVLYAIDSAGNRSAPSNSVSRALSGDDCQ